MTLSSVDERPLHVALYKGGTWYNWGKSTQASVVWEVPFVAGNHLLGLTPDPAFPTLQRAVIPNAALVACDAMIMFTNGVPISTVDVPPNLYTGPYPGVFTLR